MGWNFDYYYLMDDNLTLLDDVIIYRDIGIGATAMIIFYKFATTVTNNAAVQMLQLHTDFLTAYKDNTKALIDLVVAFREHTLSKDMAIKLLEERYKKE